MVEFNLPLPFRAEDFARLRGYQPEFLEQIWFGVRAWIEQGIGVTGFTIDPPKEIGGKWFRFVRVHIEGQRDLTWYEQVD